MTREQESDSTLPPDREERGISLDSPQRTERMRSGVSSSNGDHIPQIMIPPKVSVCSFCGIGTHGYKDCPVMHQYIREQADALAQKRVNEYQQMQEWTKYKPSRQMWHHPEPLREGGEIYRQGTLPGQKPYNQETQGQRDPTKVGTVGSLYSRPVGGLAPGGGGGTPPPGRGGTPADRIDDGPDEEEEDETDRDEETMSVTSSSQTSAGRARLQREKGNNERGARGPPEDPNDPGGEGNIEEGRCGPRGHRGQRGRTRPPGRDGAPGPMGPVGPRGLPGRDAISTLGAP